MLTKITNLENSISPTLSLGAAFIKSESWTLVRSHFQDPRRYKKKMRVRPQLWPAQFPPQPFNYWRPPSDSQPWQGLKSNCCWVTSRSHRILPSPLESFLPRTLWPPGSGEIVTDPFFAPSLKCATSMVGGLVDTKGRAVQPAASRPADWTFIIGLLYRWGQGEADRLCIPEWGNLRQRIISECHNTL